MRYRCATPARKDEKKIVKDLIRVNPLQSSCVIRPAPYRFRLVTQRSAPEEHDVAWAPNLHAAPDGAE